MIRLASVFGIAVVALFLAHALYPACVAEDAFISFRFASNLVEGHGLLWNPGEPPVEGYTNFLWLLICALLLRLGLDLVGAVEQVSVNDGSWSLARNLDEEGREFLFERELDPQEDANLVDLEPAAAQRMRAVLDTHLSVKARADTRATNVRIDPKVAELLRAVGYLQ